MKRFLPVVLFLTFVLTAAANFEITDDEGTETTGVPVRIDAGKVVLRVDGETLDIPLARIVTIRNTAVNSFRVPEMPERRDAQPGAKPPGRGAAAVFDKKKETDAETEDPKKTYPETVTVLDLADGSTLICTGFTLKGKTATAKLLNDRELPLPINRIASARLVAKSLVEARTAPPDWLRLAAASDKGDRIVVGTPGALDVYDGILSEVGAETVSFVIDGETLPVPRRKVFGLVFHREAVPEPSETRAVGILSLRDGSRLQLADVPAWEEGDQLTWTTRHGISGSVDLGDVDSIDFSRKNAVFLVELQPSRVEQSFLFDREPPKDEKTPSYSLLREFRTNRILSAFAERPEPSPLLQAAKPRQSGRTDKLPDRPLPGLAGVRLDGNVYEKGLSLPARTVLEYALSEPFTALRGTAGIDDRLRPDGAATLVIQADDELLGTFPLRGDRSAERIHVKLPGTIRMLRIVVDFPEASLRPAAVGLGDFRLENVPE